VVISDDWWWLK